MAANSRRLHSATYFPVVTVVESMRNEPMLSRMARVFSSDTKQESKFLASIRDKHGAFWWRPSELSRVRSNWKHVFGYVSSDVMLTPFPKMKEMS